MRHGKKFNHLGRTAPHRKAMLSNMAASLFLHKRISTTLAKAKELKKHVEPLVTRAKVDTTHNRRIAFRFLQNKEAIKVLFGEVVDKVANRPGGYTRIIKTGFRLGDNAEMCIIELVDFNELMLKESKPAKKTTRRSRRGSAKPASSEEVTDTADTEEITDTATDAEEITDVAADVEEVATTADDEEVTETATADDAPQAEADQDDIKNDADENTESNEDKKAE